MVLRLLRTSGNSCTDVRDDRLYWAAGTAQLDAQHLQNKYFSKTIKMFKKRIGFTAW
jgi:hypothetical protein